MICKHTPTLVVCLTLQKIACILLCVKLVGAVLLNQFIVQTEDQNRGSPLPDENETFE
jgi:hypothetical protein